MAASISALVNPVLLSWARQESGYPTETVARRLNVKPERLLAWERGELKPTVRQAQGLAKLYHRPLGVFFLPQTPALPPLAAEYRRLSGMKPGVESPEFRLAVRLMSLRREVGLDLSEELGVPITEFGIAGQCNLCCVNSEVG
jgi:transcriptional regulator with XRE-family HTH domain